MRFIKENQILNLIFEYIQKDILIKMKERTLKKN